MHMLVVTGTNIGFTFLVLFDICSGRALAAAPKCRTTSFFSLSFLQILALPLVMLVSRSVLLVLACCSGQVDVIAVLLNWDESN